jgi:hypothetical protein
MSHCLKFRADGTVYHSMVWRADAAEDFVPNERDQRGIYTIEGDSVRMLFENSAGGTQSCHGRVRGEQLSVSGSYEGEYLFTAPPAPPVRSVRLDGYYMHESMYMDEVHPDRGGWDRYTLRFYSDGVVTYAYTGSWGSEAPEIRPHGADDARGTYEAGESVIQITMRLPSGETRRCYGTIESETITLTMGDDVRQFSFIGDDRLS